MATSEERARGKFLSVVDIDLEKYKLISPPYRVVSELMNHPVLTITPEASLDEAARVMGEKHIGSLIVMKYDTPVGIVTERDLLSKVLAFGLLLEDEKVEDVMSYPLTGVSPSTDVKRVAQTMMSGKGRLGVFDAGTLIGVITTSDLIKSLPDVPEIEVKVDCYMTKDVVSVDAEESVICATRIMGSQHKGSVIVTRGGEPFGIFTERDLLTNFLAKSRELFVEVGPVCSSPLIAIPADTSVHRAAATMASRHIRRLPIVQDGKILGIATARDLVRAYAI